MQPNKINVMLVDRREILREGLTAILQRDPGIEVVAKFGSGEDAIDQVSIIRPDIVITEADMPEVRRVFARTPGHLELTVDGSAGTPL